MRYTWIRFRRSPLSAIAVFLFAGLTALALCGLRRGLLAAREHYDEIYRQVRVVCTVTNLTGDQSNYLNIPPQICELFAEGAEPASFELAELLQDIRIKGSLKFDWEGEEYALVGITALRAEPGLWPENGCAVFWDEGEGESFFAGKDFKCLISGEMMQILRKREFSEDFLEIHLEPEASWEKDYEGVLEIAGTYESEAEKIIYCPWEAYREICRKAGRIPIADSLSATLKDNGELETLRERAGNWFAVPNAKLVGIDGKGGFFWALDINDVQLEQAGQNLKNSIMIIRIAAAAIFALSVGAGVLVGFLMIRSRKHEIALLRTLGTGNFRIYGSYTKEQALCVILGAAVGGAAFRWQPPYQLCLFVGAYLAGLSVMLWFYLRKNLLIVIKEEE